MSPTRKRKRVAETFFAAIDAESLRQIMTCLSIQEIHVLNRISKLKLNFFGDIVVLRLINVYSPFLGRVKLSTDVKAIDYPYSTRKDELTLISSENALWFKQCRSFSSLKKLVVKIIRFFKYSNIKGSKSYHWI